MIKPINESFANHLINRVFRHELGHYIANEINFKNNKATASKSINFHPCPEDNEDLCGRVDVEKDLKLSSNKDFVEKGLLPEFIAKTIMGCVFQCYFDSLSLCFCLNQQGIYDRTGIKWAKDKNRLDYSQMFQLSGIEDEVLKTLKINDLLEFVRGFDATNYIEMTEIENEWRVNMTKITELFDHPEYPVFEELYNNFVSQLREVIDRKQQT